MSFTTEERQDCTEMPHPVFARVFARLIRWAEPSLAEHRQALVAGLAGRVVEIGAGTGASFRHYPAEAVGQESLHPFV